jgi:D-inositol-3-phosphate glycosyltransferase
MVSEHASPLAAVGGVDAGGQNVHVAALSAALADRGHDVVVYTRRDDPGLARRVHLRRGVQVVHLDAGPPTVVGKDLLLPHMPQFAEGLTAALRRRRPAVIHAHFWMSGLAATVAGAELGLPVVQTFHALGAVKQRHQGSADTSPPGRLTVESRLARGADRVIASCRDEVRELLLLGAQRSSIDVVPCGVDTAHFTPDGPAAPRGHRPRLLVLGRMVPRKGVDDAIRMLVQVPAAELVVAGGAAAADLDRDPEARRLLELARELDVAGRVELRGAVRRAELPALIRSSDVVVCLPWYEPFGIVPLEAMACGVPVVGTAVGGLLDTVVSGVTGRLVPPRRPDLAAAAVHELLADHGLRADAGAAGVARMRARYTWNAVAAETEAAYQRACRHAGVHRWRDGGLSRPRRAAANAGVRGDAEKEATG